MKRYIKHGEIKNANEIIINKGGMNIFNPSEKVILENGWVEYKESKKPISKKEFIARALNKKLKEIIDYDSSDEVNAFYINGSKLWLDKATRVGLKLRFEAELSAGKSTTTLWYNDQPFELELENAIKMLNALELYASACYDVTKQHIASIKNTTTIKGINDYDYKVDYPEKLYF